MRELQCWTSPWSACCMHSPHGSDRSWDTGTHFPAHAWSPKRDELGKPRICSITHRRSWQSKENGSTISLQIVPSSAENRYKRSSQPYSLQDTMEWSSMKFTSHRT